MMNMNKTGRKSNKTKLYLHANTATSEYIRILRIELQGPGGAWMAAEEADLFPCEVIEHFDSMVSMGGGD